MRPSDRNTALSPAGPDERRRRQVVGLPLDRVLSFAAAPSFAAMGLYAALDSAGASGALCSTTLGAPHAAGMVTMYALMSLFHLTPWLRLIF